MTGKVLTEESFPPLAVWRGLPHEVERRRRIQLCVATYAYEVAARPIMSDSAWDEMAQSINKHQGTGHPLMDEFFIIEFSPMTGMWIHLHPELGGIQRIFDRYWSVMRDYYEDLYRRKKL